MKKKKDEGKWVRVGNYLLGIEKSSKWTRFVAKSVSGDWRVMWGEGSIMFGVMYSMAADVNSHKYLEALLTLQYVATSYPHDLVALGEKQELPLINGFCKLVDEQTAFEVSVADKATDEEDAEALKEVGEIEDIGEELSKIDTDGD